MKNLSTVDFLVSWKSPKQRSRKEVSFKNFIQAQEFYLEKDSEGKRPRLLERTHSVSFREMSVDF